MAVVDAWHRAGTETLWHGYFFIFQINDKRSINSCKYTRPKTLHTYDNFAQYPNDILTNDTTEISDLRTPHIPWIFQCDECSGSIVCNFWLTIIHVTHICVIEFGHHWFR